MLPEFPNGHRLTEIKQEDASTEETSIPLGPREEVQQFISGDDRRLGDVFRLTRDGLSPEQIADHLNVSTSGFVYSYRRVINAALDGKTSNAPSVQAKVASALRSLIARGRDQLSLEALQLLQRNLNAIERAAELSEQDVASELVEPGEDSSGDVLQRLSGVSGIYAFSYGWYLESPVDPEQQNTLIKVGQSDDVGGRIRAYASGVRTHMPEPLALIRVYSTGDRNAQEVESHFHKLLSTARHTNPRRTRLSRRSEVGREWFLTNEDFLDAIAATMGLRTEHIGLSEFASDWAITGR